jgi:hemolysin III
MKRRGRSTVRSGSNNTVSSDENNDGFEPIAMDANMNLAKSGDGVLCEDYLKNCAKLGIAVDPSVYISLQTNWNVLKPSSHFSEGAMQPLIGVLDSSQYINKLDLGFTGVINHRNRAQGNGNSNARALVSILSKNKNINDVNLRGTGLDDDGVIEICNIINNNKTITNLNLAQNNFGKLGAKALEDALKTNNTLKALDLTNNQLGFESIQQLECSCQLSGLVLMKSGNFVFEEILNATSHGVAFILSIIGTFVLMNAVVQADHTTDYHYWASAIYSFSLVYLFLASTLYHSFFMVMPRVRDVLQILDNIGIYMLIAGTYTPLLLIGMHNHTRGINLLIFEWLAAIICSMFAIYADLNHPLNNNIKLVSFVGMGGACLFMIHDIVEILPWDCVILFIIGALSYVVGIYFFIKGETRPINHTIWHLFVVIAAVLHWFGTFHYIIGMDIHIQETIDDAAAMWQQYATQAKTDVMHALETSFPQQ